MPSFFSFFFPAHRDTDADVLYCAAPAVPAQLLLASHQKISQTVCIQYEPSTKKKNSPIKDGKERHQKLFQSRLNFLSIVVCKVLRFVKNKENAITYFLFLLALLPLMAFQQL